MSVPILKGLWLDDYLRQFFLTQLVSMNHRKGMSILVESGMLVNTIPPEDFKVAMDAYSGIDGTNIEEVTAKLLEAGINEYSGVMGQSDRQAMDTRES